MSSIKCFNIGTIVCRYRLVLEVYVLLQSVAFACCYKDRPFLLGNTVS